MFLLDRFRRRREEKEAAERIVHAISTQARHSDFYSDIGVTDTLDGRFEVIVLHAMLVFRRLRAIPGQGALLADRSLDIILSHLDYALREDGASDHTIARKIRTLGESYLGRAVAYDAALNEDNGAMRPVLEKNFQNVVYTTDFCGFLELYALSVDRMLDSLSDEDVLNGQFNWGRPSVFIK